MDNKLRNRQAVGYGLLILLVGVGAIAYLVSGKTLELREFRVAELFSPACSTPIRYSVGTFDERFGLSRPEFERALTDAAQVWNDAAGKTVVEFGEDGAVPINLVYSEHQQTAQLGEVIDAEQEAYANKRAEVERIRSGYLALRSQFKAREARFKEVSAKYDEEVEYWNERGGAPPEEYQRLQEEQTRLRRDQDALNRFADEVNANARELNVEVSELNRLAARTNAKVGAYNARAGSDFDQGTYTEDAMGKHIDIYEFTDVVELKWVLAHEFGHALGLGHVENPESIMYSYNIGESFVLTAEDVAALLERCGVE